MQIPSPPLRYWTTPPSNEFIFGVDHDPFLQSQNQNNDDILNMTRPALFDRVRCLTSYLRTIKLHMDDVYQWTEICGETQLALQRIRYPSAPEHHWATFHADIRDYVHTVLQRTQQAEREIESILNLLYSLLEKLEKKKKDNDDDDASMIPQTGREQQPRDDDNDDEFSDGNDDDE